MKKVIFPLLLFITSLTVSAGVQSIEDMISAERLSDGRYKIVCIDGVEETISSSSFRAGMICTHLATKNVGELVLHRQVGGSSSDHQRMCDYKLSLKSKRSDVGHFDYFLGVLVTESACGRRTIDLACETSNPEFPYSEVNCTSDKINLKINETLFPYIEWSNVTLTINDGSDLSGEYTIIQPYKK